MSIIRVEAPQVSQGAQPVSIIEEQIVELYNIDSFGRNFGGSNTDGFQFDDNEIVMFAVRVKPNTTRTIKINHYEMCGTESAPICGYRWYENPTLSTTPTWIDLTSEIQYAFFNEYGHTPTTVTAALSTIRHAGVFSGKSSSSEEEIKNIKLTDGANPNVLVLTLRRLNGASATGVFLSINLVDLG